MTKLLEKAKECWERGKSFILPDGSELPDPRPVELPVGFERPESIQEMIRRFVTDPAIRRELEANDVESFDEADDLDIEDDLPQTPHEDRYDPLHLLTREQEIMAGAVKPRTAEELAAAREAIEEVRKKHPPKGAPAVAAAAESKA